MKTSKEEFFIETLKEQVRIDKSKAIKKAHIKKQTKYLIKTNVVLKLGHGLLEKIEKDAEDLEISKQKVIENILLKHYRLLKRG